MPLFNGLDDLTQTGISFGEILGSSLSSILSFAQGTSYGLVNSLVSTIPGFGTYLLMFALLLIIYSIYDLRKPGFLTWLKWLLIFGALSYVLTGNPAAGIIIGLFAVIALRIIKMLFSGLFHSGKNLLRDTVENLGKNINFTNRTITQVQAIEAQNTQNFNIISGLGQRLLSITRDLKAKIAEQPRTPEVIKRINELTTDLNSELGAISGRIGYETNLVQQLTKTIQGFLNELGKQKSKIDKFKPTKPESAEIKSKLQQAIEGAGAAIRQQQSFVYNYYNEISGLRNRFSTIKVTNTQSLADLERFLPALNIFAAREGIKIKGNVRNIMEKYMEFESSASSRLQASERHSPETFQYAQAA